MKKAACLCARCGRDITRARKIYPRGAKYGPLCCDCAEADRLLLSKGNGPDLFTATVRYIHQRYQRGDKLSDIATSLEMSPKEVLELLSEAIDE